MLSSVDARAGESLSADPNVEEFLADPMVRLLMRRDHVRVEDARRLFADTAALLRRRRLTAEIDAPAQPVRLRA